MALTLVEIAKSHSGEELRSAVIETFARANDILRTIPVENISGNALKFNREGMLGTVAFRGVNEAYTSNQGSLDPITEALTIAGGDLDVDKFIVDTHGPDSRSIYETMKIKGLAQTIGHKIVKGSSTTDPKEFDGFQVRSVGTQLIANGATANGDVLSLAKLDSAIDATSMPTHLIMSRAMRNALTVASRTTTVGGNIQWTKDEFGQRLTVYNDLPILIADGLEDVNATLAFDEANPGGGTSTGTSIYVASFTEGGVMLLQNGDMQVRDLGELDAQPWFRTRVEWYVALAQIGPRSLTRLWGIATGAAVA